MPSPRLFRAGVGAVVLATACFNPDDGATGSGPGTADSSGSGSASLTDTDGSSDPTPGSQTMTDPSDSDPTPGSQTATDPSDTDPSDSDPTDTDATDTMVDDSTGDVPAACGDGIVSAGEFCPVDPPDLVALGAGAVDVVVAELDADASIDIALLGRASSTVSVIANDGTGTFGAPLVLDVVENTCSLAAVDGEGDGDIDLVVEGTELVTLTSNGAGGFTRTDSDSSNTFGCDDWNNVDVLNDNGGALDVVYSGTYNNTYAPGLVSGGLWQFGASDGIDNAGEGSSGITVTEFAFDADNDPDVIVLNQYFTTASLWAGDGMGSFVDLGEIDGCAGLDGAGGSRYAAAGDLTGDGAIDIVITCMAGNFVVVPGTNTASFMAPIEVLLAGAHQPVLVDIDGDDDLDILISSTVQQAIYVYLNDGGDPEDPIVLDLPGEPRGLDVGDLDGDGALEIVAAVDDGAQSGVAIVRTDP